MTDQAEGVFSGESPDLDLAAFVRDSADQIYLIDATSGRFIYANQRALDETGYTLAKLATMTPMDLQVDADVETVVHRVASLRTGERDSITFHTAYRTKDGGSMPVEHQVQYARAHHPPVFVVHARPIARAAPIDGSDEVVFASVVREAIDQIYVIDALSGRFIYANERAQQETGYTLDELTSMTMLDIEAGSDLGSMLEGIAPLRSGEVDSLTFDTEYRNKDGSRFPVEHRVQLLASHEPPVYVVRARSDVEPSGRSRHDSDLYRHVVEEADEGIWVIDDEQRTTYANRAIAGLLGYTRDEMLGRSVFDFMDDESKAIATANFERRREGVHQQSEFKYVRKDGSELWTIIASHPMFDPTGRYTGAYAIVTDITERKLQEQALLRSLHVSSPQELIESPVLPVLVGSGHSRPASSLRADRLAKRFGVLADPRRLELIELLAPGDEYSVNAISVAVNMTQPNVSKHLKVLYDAGLVSRRADGNRALYALTDPTAAVLCRVVCQWLGNQAQAEYEALAS